MKAKLVFHVKNVDKQGNIVEMKIWQVKKTEDKPHGLKYSLVYIENGQRIVGYDNAEGKGDHKHYFDKELRYTFESIEKLVKDFWEDVKRAKSGEL
jgi:hypothetical protein